MKYRHVIFDADGTLFDFQRASVAAMAETFADHDLAFTAAHFAAYEEINARYWRIFEQGGITPTGLRVGRFREFLEHVGADLEPEPFSRHYLQRLSTHHDLLPGALACVEALAPHAGLLLLTNGLAEVQTPRFAAAPICRHFRDIVISGVVGVAKPDPAIFDMAFARLGHPARDDVIMVGDSLTSDMQGGHAYGLATCWFNPGRRERVPDVPVTHEIADLAELAPLLGVPDPAAPGQRP